MCVGRGDWGVWVLRQVEMQDIRCRTSNRTFRYEHEQNIEHRNGALIQWNKDWHPKGAPWGGFNVLPIEHYMTYCCQSDSNSWPQRSEIANPKHCNDVLALKTCLFKVLSQLTSTIGARFATIIACFRGLQVCSIKHIFLGFLETSWWWLAIGFLPSIFVWPLFQVFFCQNSKEVWQIFVLFSLSSRQFVLYIYIDCKSA